MASSSSTGARNATYQPGLALFSALGAAWVFVLVMLGAFTTSIGAGMVFSDWPLSNGSINPHGWLTDVAMFAEHSHRLSAGLMAMITFVLAVWLGRTERRVWLRRLVWWAVGLVLMQAVVGGLRVLLDQRHIGMVDTSVGRLFAMLHAVLAQLFACTLIAIAAACSRSWIEGADAPTGRAVRRLGLLCCVLLFVQLAIAAVMRHSFAGMAIPTFPASNFDGGLLPHLWNFRIAIHFAHRAMAAVLCVAIPWFVFTLVGDANASSRLRAGAVALLVLLTAQIFLGAQIIWTYRAAYVTTGHVVVGALTLVTTFWLTWRAHRDAIEGKPAT
ncbi:MAG: cytochrome oxidase assembly [Verrucomicrobia bacterium]|nr:cytochrome oxidase assembly [Verrucomicrobiota bacterium]